MVQGDPRHSGRSRTRAWSLGPIVLVLALVAAAFASFEFDLGRRLGIAAGVDSPAEIAPPGGMRLPALTTPGRVAPALPEPGASSAKVRAALAPYLRHEDLGKHALIAVADAGGRLLLDNRGGAVVPASTLKLVTAVAALESLGPERTFDTRVVRGARANEVVLVGGGDPYLSATPASPQDYPPHADVRALARQTADALRAEGRRSVRLRFDDSLFTGPASSPSWPDTYLPEMVVAPISPLWVDQGQKRDGWGFVSDPAADAALVFASELGRAGIEVIGTPSRAVAGEEARELAIVRSAPVRRVVDEVLATSDNEGAELLAHHIGIAEGHGGSFAGGIRGMTAVMERLGVPLGPRDVVYDGSGLSRENRITAPTLLGVLALAADPQHPALREALSTLPVAGFTGSLSGRYVEGAVQGRGRVRAKTGTLTGVHGLAGVATDLDGNTLLFVMIADRVATDDYLAGLDARDLLDVMTAALGACHCS